MSEDEIRQLIYREFTEKTLGVTEQYLKIHQPVYKGGLPLIATIDRNNGDPVVAYVPVENEHFLFAIYFNEDDGEIYSVNTLPRNQVSLVVTSDSMSANKLSSLTKLVINNSWNKGEPIYENNNVAHYKSNGIEIDPNPGPDEFENKLKRLLAYLYEDVEGINILVTQASAHINVVMDFHRGNQHIGASYIDLECVKMMSDLNLEISFDIWAWGNPFTES